MEQKFFPCLIYIVTNIYVSDCYNYGKGPSGVQYGL